MYDNIIFQVVPKWWGFHAAEYIFMEVEYTCIALNKINLKVRLCRGNTFSVLEEDSGFWAINSENYYIMIKRVNAYI